MVDAVTVNAVEAGALSVNNAPSNIRASEGGVVSVYNVPAMTMRSSQAMGGAVFNQVSSIRVIEAGVLAVVGGRVSNFKTRVSQATLDGHDFVFFRLGDDATLVYDVYSEQWVDWDSKDNGAWRANFCINWSKSGALSQIYGSGVVCGDDTFGTLWFLDPKQAWDDNPDPAGFPQQMDFIRVATGQVMAPGRDQKPCYAVFVDGDNYGLSGTQFTPTVTLSGSDDQTQTFVNYGTLPALADPAQNNPYAWYSLGQISSPGRIFRITDNGVFARIDSMDMNDDAG